MLFGGILLFNKHNLNKFKEKIVNRDVKLYKDYDDVLKEYNNFPLDVLKKEKATVSAKITADDWWMKRCGPSQLLSTNAIVLSSISILLSLCVLMKNDLLFYLSSLIAILFIIIVSFLGTGNASKKYDYLEPKYLENKLRLEVLNQMIEEKQSYEFGRYKKCVNKRLYNRK